jgi:hypothetical protein
MDHYLDFWQKYLGSSANLQRFVYDVVVGKNVNVTFC